MLRNSDPAPRGHTGTVPPQLTACAPQTKIVPPQARTVPRRNLQGQGFWSANRGPNYCFWWTDTRFNDVFGMKTFFYFFLEIACFRPEKPLEFAISAGKSLAISMKTFFWRSPVFGRKNRLNLRFLPENPFDFVLLTFFISSRLG